MDSIKTNQTQKMNGLERGWHENGLPSYEGCYKNEERDGEHKEWYENGKICPAYSTRMGSWRGYKKSGMKVDIFSLEIITRMGRRMVSKK